jgi:hypothetical protein
MGASSKACWRNDIEELAMLGWGISIWRHKRTGYIGGWTIAGFGKDSLDWFDHLVASGQAEYLGGSGYPLYYKMTASHLASALKSEPPTGAKTCGVILGDDYVARGGAVSGYEIHWGELEACKPDEVLDINVWDLS